MNSDDLSIDQASDLSITWVAYENKVREGRLQKTIVDAGCHSKSGRPATGKALSYVNSIHACL